MAGISPRQAWERLSGAATGGGSPTSTPRSRSSQGGSSPAQGSGPSSGPAFDLDSDSAQKITRIHRRLTEYFHVLANEPSLGLFRIQEHVHKSVPLIVHRKRMFQRLSATLDDRIALVDEATDVIAKHAAAPAVAAVRSKLARTLRHAESLTALQQVMNRSSSSGSVR